MSCSLQGGVRHTWPTWGPGLPVLGGLGWESSRQLLDSTLLRGAEAVGKPQSSGGNAGCRGRAAEECPEGAPSHQGEGLWARVALTDGNLRVLIVPLLFPIVFSPSLPLPSTPFSWALLTGL